MEHVGVWMRGGYVCLGAYVGVCAGVSMLCL